MTSINPRTLHFTLDAVVISVPIVMSTTDKTVAFDGISKPPMARKERTKTGVMHLSIWMRETSRYKYLAMMGEGGSRRRIESEKTESCWAGLLYFFREFITLTFSLLR